MAPEYVTARVNLAYAFEQAGRLSQAIEAYERVLGQDPGHTTARNNLANLYSRSGRHEDAIRELEAILQQKPDDTTARRNLDTAKRNKSILDERDQQSARALTAAESRPSDPRAAYEVARVFAQQGDHEKALAWLDKALQLGYDQIEFLRVDPALTALRNDARFGQLLERRAAK
jgi:tetratricopeptide (TPR) repeat protein